MKITFNQALATFLSVKPLNIEKTKNAKLLDIYIELFPIVKKHDDMIAQVQKDREELKAKYDEKIAAATEDIAKAKLREEFKSNFLNSVSAKALAEFENSEIEVSLPSLTRDEWRALGSHLTTLGELSNFEFLVEK